MLSAGLATATVIKTKNILSAALKQAVTNHIIKSNPVQETIPPKLDQAEIRILTKDEQARFVAALPFYNTRYMFSVALATGMRIGEICALTVSDINRENKYININKTAGRRKDKYTGVVSLSPGPPKTMHSNRRIPLLPSVQALFDKQELHNAILKEKAGAKWKENNLMFPTDEGGIHDLSGLRSTLIRILARAGLDHINIHAIRHTYATNALNSGVPPHNVARLLGHKDGATTLKFYAHYIHAEAVEQLQKLEIQNVMQYGITSEELQAYTNEAISDSPRSTITELIDDTIARFKNSPPLKGAEKILDILENYLSNPIDHLPDDEKILLINAISKYAVLKRTLEEQMDKNNTCRMQVR